MWHYAERPRKGPLIFSLHPRSNHPQAEADKGSLGPASKARDAKLPLQTGLFRGRLRLSL
jgi:hypothetical protein